MTSRLVWKVAIAYLAFAALVSALLVSVVAQQQRRQAVAALEQRLYETALALQGELGAALINGPNPELQDRLRLLEQQTAMRVTVVAADGTVLGDSSEDPALMGNHRDRPELQQARRQGFGLSRRGSSTLAQPMIYTAVRVGKTDEPLGYIRTAGAVDRIDRQLAPVRKALSAGLAGITAVGLVLVVIGVFAVTGPLRRLTSALRLMAADELSQSVPVDRTDELGTLAASFNEMNRHVVRRIGDLDRLSRQLEDNGRRLETVLGGMIEGVLAVDEHERILFANKAARFMLEFTGTNVVGRPVWETVRNPTIHEVVRNALAGTPHRSIEFELPRTQAVVALLATRLPGDPCPGVVLVLHDVTDLRRLENLRREFVSNVSHELKTPLTSIQAYTETLLAGAIDDDAHNREFLRRIEDQADRLHKLILDLLRLARIESGKDVFEVTAVPLDRTVQACIEQHAALADSKQITLSAEPPPENIRVQADAEGLRTILDNLVDNAIKYTPEGGRVAVRWRAEDQAAVVEVEDTGIGIAKPHQLRIFERFYRADKARSRELGGTGLGLSIVKHLTQVFEGSVEVASEAGKGSTFTVRLPIA